MRINKESLNSFVNIFFWACLVTFFFFFWKRLSFCVDLTDESLYSALPVRFFKGGAPYKDELLLVQNSGLLLEPIVWLYSLFQPKLDGIVFYFRAVYFFLALGTGVLPFLFIRKFMDFWTSVWSVLLIVTFVPFAIPSLSYNTLSSFFLIMSVICFGFHRKILTDARPSLPTESTEWYFISGICLIILAVFVYPTLSIIAVFLIPFLMGLQWKARGFDITLKVSFLICSVALISAIYIVFVWVGLARIEEMLHYTMSMQVHLHSAEKIAKLGGQIWLNRLFYGPFFAVFILLPYLFRIRFLGPLAILLLILFLKKFALVDGMINHHAITAFSLLPFFYIFSKNVREFMAAHSELRLILIISSFLGLCFWWTSGNGLPNQPLGALGAVLIAILFLHQMIPIHKSKFSLAFCVMLICAAQLRIFWLQHYGDDDPSTLNTVVSTGPYKGLITTAEKNAFLNQLQEDLQSVSEGARTVAGFDSASVVYLSSHLDPLTPTVWTYFSTQLPSDKRILMAYYERLGKKPDILVWMKKLPVLSNYELKEGSERSELKEYLIGSKNEPVFDRSWYAIYNLNETSK